jgi:head-tail adaptor
MRPGEFRDIIDIERDSSAAGAALPDYTGSPLLSDVPCKITSLSGSETWRGRQLEAHRSHVIELQYVAGVRATMRAKVRSGLFDGCILNIADVRPLEIVSGKARKLELYCTEVAPQ